MDRPGMKLTKIIDPKSVIALTRLKRRYSSLNQFKKRMLSKNIHVGLDDTFYFIEQDSVDKKNKIN